MAGWNRVSVFVEHSAEVHEAAHIAADDFIWLVFQKGFEFGFADFGREMGFDDAKGSAEATTLLAILDFDKFDARNGGKELFGLAGDADGATVAGAVEGDTLFIRF